MGGRLQLRDGPPLGLGSIVESSVRGGLPFTLDFIFKVIRFEPSRLIEVRSWGDIQGTGLWQLREHLDGALFTYRWDVGLTSSVLDFFGRNKTKKRLLARNHTNVMKRTFRAMNGELSTVAHNSLP